MSCWGWQLGLSGMRDRFSIFGAVIRIRKLSLLLVIMLRITNTLQPLWPPMIRSSPCWIHIHHRLFQVTTDLQLNYHITLGLSRHVINVSSITSSYDIETGRSSTRSKWYDAAIILDLVLAPNGWWINLCDHGNVLLHLFWTNLTMYRAGP